MKLQRLLSLTRQAVDDYRLIQSGDKIAIGISGGKDSLTLLYALQGLRRFYPEPFELCAITVDLGFQALSPEVSNRLSPTLSSDAAAFDLKPVQELCDELNVPYTVVPTEIGKILFETRQESNPCALCAKMRKGALNEAALKLGCNKIAYAHHRDDLIETMLLSLIYEGRFYSFSPKTHLDKTGLTLIRPLMYVQEADVMIFVFKSDHIGFKNKYHLPVCKNPCPVDGKTKREYVKQLTRKLNHDSPGVKDRFFHAIIDGNNPGWPERTDRHLKNLIHSDLSSSPKEEL